MISMAIETIDPLESKWSDKVNANFAELEKNDFTITQITLTGLNGWTLNGSGFYATNGFIQIDELDFIATNSNAVPAGQMQELVIGKLGTQWPEWVVSTIGNWKDATTQMFTIQNGNEIHLHTMGNLISAGNGLHLHQTSVSPV